MEIIKFDTFKVTESAAVSGQTTLYRLTSHPVVDLSDPGEYYVSNEADISPDLLKKKANDLFLITVKCMADNIDLDKSDQESSRLNVDSVVSVKDSKKCEVVKVEPYQI